MAILGIWDHKIRNLEASTVLMALRVLADSASLEIPRTPRRLLRDLEESLLTVPKRLHEEREMK